MTSARVLARVFARSLALAAATGCAVAAQAQNMPWPTDAPPPPAANAPWPAPAAPAALPMPMPGTQSAPMPGMQPGPPPPGMTMGGPGPTAEQQKCMQDFQGYRQEVEKRARAAEAESKKKPTREKMCELVSLYSNAEFKWMKFSETNMAKCGIPKQAIEQIKQVHVHTADAKKKLCSAGPAQAAPAAPSLSDALVATPQPNTDESAKKRKVGGTMDTLTGNVLAR